MDVRMRKKTGRGAVLILLPAVLAAAVFLSGCAVSREKSGARRDGPVKIGISVYDHYDTFILEMMGSLEELVKGKESETGEAIDLEVENAAGSQIEQNSQIEDFISNGCDIICVNLVDRTDPSMIIDKARAADIPVIFFNRELVEEDLERWDRLYYVGAVALESGIKQGQMVVEACRENMEDMDKNGDGVLQYVMLEGEAGHQDAIVRTEYSVNTVTEAGIPVEKLAYAIANWNRAQAQTKMSQWIEQMGPDIEVVFANNDDMALGAIDAYKLSGKERGEWPFIVGIDGTTVGLEAVRDKTLDGTVYNDAYGQAGAMLELAYALAARRDLPEDIELMEGKYIRLPYEIVTAENLEEFLRKKARTEGRPGPGRLPE